MIFYPFRTFGRIMRWLCILLPALSSGRLAAQQILLPTELDVEVFRLLEDSILVITARTYRADTGSIAVPENRSDERSRTIRLPIQRVRALSSDENRPPIFWLSGGPGQSNMNSFQYDYFIGEHDHVMVGYRGVDGDISLDCPEITEILEEGGDILSPDIIEAVAGGYSDCGRRLRAEGVDLLGYTPLEVAHDLEAARIHLGYGKIFIVAESYGTRIAYLYAQLYPENIERMVMVGANPPGHMVWDPYQNDRLLRRYAELWKADPDASSRYPDLEDAILKVEQDYPERWLFMPIHEGTVRASVNAFLFHTESAARAFDAYVAAADGDASGLWIISFVGSGIFPSVVNWGDNASKAMSGDFVPGIDYRTHQDPDDALFGAPLGAFLWSAAESAHWPYRALPEEYRQVAPTEVPTLFLSGSLDLSTPAENVEADFVPRFPNSTHVVLSEAGHIMDLWRSQPAATRQLVRSYIETGSIDTSRFVHKPVSFDVSWGFPVLAKLIIFGIMFVVLLLMGLGIIGFRRLRRPRS